MHLIAFDGYPLNKVGSMVPVIEEVHMRPYYHRRADDHTGVGASLPEWADDIRTGSARTGGS
jgi:hypothetical protein